MTSFTWISKAVSESPGLKQKPSTVAEPPQSVKIVPSGAIREAAILGNPEG
jgi:hypothetical protein